MSPSTTSEEHNSPRPSAIEALKTRNIHYETLCNMCEVIGNNKHYKKNLCEGTGDNKHYETCVRGLVIKHYEACVRGLVLTNTMKRVRGFVITYTMKHV